MNNTHNGRALCSNSPKLNGIAGSRIGRYIGTFSPDGIVAMYGVFKKYPTIKLVEDKDTAETNRIQEGSIKGIAAR
jgi:hypothetical protein